jgi:ACS family hexuronate transporter-like MFS transporter
MILWWSAANFLHGTVTGVYSLGVFRFLLGMGEGGGFPGSAKAVADWFPPKERSFAFGIFNTGSSIGAVIAPPMIAATVIFLNWRWVFFITGALGFVWAAAWLKFYHSPDRHPMITSQERELIETSLSTARETDTGPSIPWIHLFVYPQLWGLLVTKFLSDGAWYFYIFWIPKYLSDVRHLNIKQIGYYAWIPYAFAGAGSLLGGWFSSYLIRRNLSVGASRKISLGIAASLMPVALLIATSPLSLAIVFFSMAMFGHQFFSTIMQTLTADMFPSKVVGSVAGLVGTAGSFGGMIFNVIVGMLLTRYHSYSIVFLISGLLHPTGFLLILLLVRKVEMLIRVPASPSFAART